MSNGAQKPLRILAINPGSTSTKLALFVDERTVVTETVAHSHDQMQQFRRIPDQYSFRRDAVLDFMQCHSIEPASLDAVVGRGGILRPLESGTYVVSEAMLAELRAPSKERDHVVNLAALIADEVARQGGVPAFVVDPVSVDEFEPLARISGLPQIERRALAHVLSLKSIARRAAAELHRPFAELNLVIAHMGGGISVCAQRQGRIVDVNQALDGTGPFSPERVGGLPVGDVLRLAFSGKYTYDELFRLFTRQGGLLAHLGTNDAAEVERRIARSDEHARLVYEAMAYQIAKEIGLMATVLKGQVDAVVLAGGLARSAMLTGWIGERVGWIARVLVYPGEDEMLAMAQGALRVLRGEEPLKVYA